MGRRRKKNKRRYWRKEGIVRGPDGRVIRTHHVAWSEKQPRLVRAAYGTEFVRAPNGALLRVHIGPPTLDPYSGVGLTEEQGKLFGKRWLE